MFAPINTSIVLIEMWGFLKPIKKQIWLQVFPVCDSKVSKKDIKHTLDCPLLGSVTWYIYKGLALLTKR